MLVTLDHSSDTAHNVKTFYFKPPQALRYIAGQFIELFLPHDHADSRGQKHWFTLSSSPTEPLLSITTQFATGRQSTFKQTLAALQPGDQVAMTEPMGDFVLPKDTTIPIMFVAGGIGITPMHSMVQWLADQHERRPMHLLYAVSHPEDIAFADLFHSYLGARFQPYITGGGQNPLTTQQILAQTPDISHCLFYLSGPEQMVEVFTKELIGQNIASHRIITDYFHGYLPID